MHTIINFKIWANSKETFQDDKIWNFIKSVEYFGPVYKEFCHK